MDVLDPDQRRKNMRAIRGKDTKPELLLRRKLHSLGYRYRLHHHDMPGRPDIVLSRFNTVIFVHGCFWHMHKCAGGQVSPKTNAEFWRNKRLANVERDMRAVIALKKLGWKVRVVWECELRAEMKIERRLRRWLPK